VSQLEFKNLEKKFAGGFCLKSINFSFHTSGIYGILGANGAGKSTLFELITGQIDATSGHVVFHQENMRPDRYDLRKKMGYLPQIPRMPHWATGTELMSYVSRLYGCDRATADAALRRWDCENFKDKPLIRCSYGMQKRLALAVATVHDPELLILDEPFEALDILHIHSLNDYLIARRAAGKMTFLTTHIAEYALKLCDEIYIMKSGVLSKLTLEKSLPNDQKLKVIEQSL